MIQDLLSKFSQLSSFSTGDMQNSGKMNDAEAPSVSFYHLRFSMEIFML